MPPSNRGGYYFYDLNAKANYEINNKNKLFYAVIAKLNEEIPEAERFMDDLINFVLY